MTPLIGHDQDTLPHGDQCAFWANLLIHLMTDTFHYIHTYILHIIGNQTRVGQLRAPSLHHSPLLLTLFVPREDLYAFISRYVRNCDRASFPHCTLALLEGDSAPAHDDLLNYYRITMIWRRIISASRVCRWFQCAWSTTAVEASAHCEQTFSINIYTVIVKSSS